MLRRANSVVTRARERIRAAREHDPHAWPERDDDRAILVRDDEVEPIDFVEIPPDVDGNGHGGATTPPRGSPKPGAPDLDSRGGAGGVRGPTVGRQPHRLGVLAPPPTDRQPGGG